MRTTVHVLGWALAVALLASGPAGCLGGLAKIGAKSGGNGARKSAGCGDDVGRGATRRMVGGGHVASSLAHDVIPDGGRVAVFVNDDGDGVRLMLRSGEILAEDPADVGRAFARIERGVDHRGYDLFLEPDSLTRLPELDVDADSRLWLVTEGIPRLLQLGDDGIARVAVAMTKDGEPRLWVRLVSDTSDAIVRLSEQYAKIDDILLVDADCADPSDVRISVGRVEELPQTRGRVVLLSEAPLDGRLLEIARISGVEIIAYGPMDVCGPDGVPYGDAAETVQRALWARTWGDIWAVGATGTLPLVIGDITGAGHWVSMSGDGFAASVDVRDPSAVELPPFWVWVVGGGFGGLGAGLFLLWRRGSVARG